MNCQQIAGIVPPGDILRREIESRGWSQCDLAEILGRPIQAVNMILNGKKAITAATARELEDATSIDAATWLNLESQYRLSLEKNKSTTVGDRGELFSRTPLADLRRRGWVRNSRDVALLRKDVLKLLRKRSLSDPPQLKFAARKSTNYSEVTPGQEAWCCRAFEIASSIEDVPRYSAKALNASLNELRSLGETTKSVGRLPSALRDLGIRFLIVEHLPKTKIDGATLWLSKTRPVIVLSLRYGRIDYVLFTLFHEIMHVLHGDAFSVDNDVLPDHTNDRKLPDYEVRANEDASEVLIPRRKLDAFIRKSDGQIGRNAIKQFASEIAIHPGVVLGQLQHRGAVGWTACRDFLEPVRESLLKVAVTDGWGKEKSR